MGERQRRFEHLRQDLSYAVRGFRREPGLTLIAIVILALGIGANTAVFSIVNPLVLRSLPLQDADRLVWIANSGGGLSGRTYRVDVYEAIQQQSRSFEGLAAYFAFFGYDSRTLTGNGEPERLVGVPVARRFFEVLGVQPGRGRFFTPDEHRRGGPRSVVLGHQLWQRRFNADPAIVGSAINISGVPHTVVGVMPPAFDFASIFTPGTRVDMFMAADLEEMRPWGNTLSIVGRLRPGVGLDEMRAELAAIAPRITEINRGYGAFRPAITTLKDAVGGRMRRALLVLWAAVGLVLLIVCANLANLLLARAAARGREFAVRIALGATRARLIRQLITEGLVLSTAGAALGIPLAYALTAWVAGSDTLTVPLLHYVRVDAAALAVTAGIALLSTLLFATAPALRVSSQAPQSTLQEHSRGSIDSARQALVRRGLVVLEVALAAVLLVGAGLLTRSFANLLDVDLGFEPSRAIAMRIEANAIKTEEEQLAVSAEAVRRVAALPGVEGAGLTDALPLDRERTWGIRVPGTDNGPQGRSRATFVYVVGPGYFRAMGIPLKAGRDFADSDRALKDREKEPRAVILNETLARNLFPGVDPIGRAAVTGSMPVTVVGVVSDVRQSSLDEAPAGQMYLAIAQGGAAGGDLIVRSALPTSAIVPAIRRALAEVDGRLLATEVRAIESLVDRAASPRRFLVLLLGGFSILALILASLGIYGVVSYGVSQRTAEIGVRMALGATARDVRTQILADTLRMASLGIALGTAASLGLSRVLSTLLFGTSATDPLTFGLTVAVLVLVAAVAGYLPAHRASRIEPIRALRAE